MPRGHVPFRSLQQDRPARALHGQPDPDPPCAILAVIAVFIAMLALAGSGSDARIAAARRASAGATLKSGHVAAPLQPPPQPEVTTPDDPNSMIISPHEASSVDKAPDLLINPLTVSAVLLFIAGRRARA